ncbi:MAG: anaerobic ribonucleoside-triphosphate reductase activating protein [Planctomycetota bacterium]|jgi:pyruvate formate lyase activating enzyme
MKIGGLNKFSLSDYPGLIAAVVFMQGCNFRCSFCHNGSLISNKAPDSSLISEEKVFEFLKDRNNQFDGVVITGGEPTIQPGLPEFIHRIVAMELLVKLDTNGSLPEVLRKLMKEKLIDFIAMDIKAPLDIYDHLTGVQTSISRIKESIELIARSGIAHEFRTTVVKQLLSPQDLLSIKKLVPVGSTHRLQKFRPEHALNPVLQTYIIPPRFSGDK